MGLFQDFSWQQFLKLFLTATIVYYSALLIFYRASLIRAFKGKYYPGLIKKTIEQQNEFRKDNSNRQQAISLVHELLEELKHLFIIASLNNHSKEQLLMSLQLKLRDYKEVKASPLREEISEHIAHESKEQCSIALSDAELNMLWDG